MKKNHAANLSEAKPAEALITALYIEGNTSCFDCGKNENDWVSMAFGIFLCINCASFHRSMGTHITSVRSCKLDVWEPHQVQALLIGGNKAFRAHVDSIRQAGDETSPYDFARVLYYREILSAQVDRREVADYDEDYWEGIVSHRHASPVPTRPIPTSAEKQVEHWLPDEHSNNCMICSRKFSVLDRRHHCRKCGKLVCGKCGPKDNSKPILEMGLMQAVRHCRECYKSPGIIWTDLD